MAVVVDDKTKLVVQGITGYQGRYHSQAMREFGTKVVAGTSHGKSGESVNDILDPARIDELSGTSALTGQRVEVTRA